MIFTQYYYCCHFIILIDNWWDMQCNCWTIIL